MPISDVRALKITAKDLGLVIQRLPPIITLVDDKKI